MVEFHDRSEGHFAHGSRLRCRGYAVRVDTDQPISDASGLVRARGVGGHPPAVHRVREETTTLEPFIADDQSMDSDCPTALVELVNRIGSQDSDDAVLSNDNIPWGHEAVEHELPLDLDTRIRSNNRPAADQEDRSKEQRTHFVGAVQAPCAQ